MAAQTPTKNLDSLLDSAFSLLTHLQSSLSLVQQDNSPPSSTASPVDAFALARDATHLIRAHATKVSLLLTNAPSQQKQPPAALSAVVADLIEGPVPALASAAQGCDPLWCGVVLRRELALLAGRVLAGLAGLLRFVSGAASLDDDNQSSVQATAILWSACDALIQMTSSAPAGFFVAKARQSEELLKDVADELREWGQQEPDYEDVYDDDDDDEDDDQSFSDDDDDDDDDDDSSPSAQSLIDHLLSPQPIPTDDPSQIRPRLATTLRLLRLATLLLGAAHRRRLPDIHVPGCDPDSPLPTRLDALARVLDGLPERFEDLAAALYALRPVDVDDALRRCVRDARHAADLLADDWDGAPDRFTLLVDRFRQEVKLPEPEASKAADTSAAPSQG